MKMKALTLFYILLFSLFTVQASLGRSIVIETPAGSLSGTVTDAAGRQPIPGATVSIPDLKNVAITDVKGHYVLNHVPKGIYLVQVRFIGYATEIQSVDFSKTTLLDVKLKTSSVETGEVVITGVTHATELKRSPIPIVAVSKTFIDQRAAAGNVIDEIAISQVSMP